MANEPIALEPSVVATTYYEICMKGEAPLVGIATAESADLREELECLKAHTQIGPEFEARVRRSDLSRVLSQSRDSGDDWVLLRLRLKSS